jgi:ResB-like family protein
MRQTVLARRVLGICSSLRLAVVVMLTLAGTCAFATFYEMSHGTPAVQRDIYRTPAFALLLGLLGVNIFAVMVSRWPWQKHHTGFVIAHVGILTLLAGSLISLHRGLDSNLPLYEGETSDRVSLLERALHVSVPGVGSATFPVEFEKNPPSPERAQRFRVPGSDVMLVADSFLPHVEVKETFEEADEGAPALHFSLQAPMATQEAWLAADDPAHATLDLGMVSFALHAAASEAEARERVKRSEGANRLTFVAAPGGAVWFGATGQSGAPVTGKVEPGQPVKTNWPALVVTVDRVLPHAAAHRTVAPAPLPEKEERRLSAVRVHLESPTARTEPDWLLWTEGRSLTFRGGRASVAYRAPEAALPFKVTLLRFNSDRYPGSSMAATYESWVRVDDPELGSSEHHISMNHPLHYRGYIFFQSSFVEGEPMMSIFSVARSPGLPLVYTGTTLIACGVIWMFYLKPYLARRQAARALLAHRERESRHEAAPSRPVPSRPGPAETAPGGA